MHRASPVLPFAAVLAAIALLSLMDALMKGASLAIGAYSTLVVRSVFGLTLAAPLWRSDGVRRSVPTRTRPKRARAQRARRAVGDLGPFE